MLLPRTVKDCSVAEAAYLAGIVDGEGSFTVRTNTNTFGMKVGTTDECLAVWLKKHFGGIVASGGRTVTGKAIYRWTLQRQSDLLYVLPTIEPYLVIKKRQARAMVALIEHLQRKPTYSHIKRTAKLPHTPAGDAERKRRLAELGKWRRRTDALRLAVREVRFSD